MTVINTLRTRFREARQRRGNHFITSNDICEILDDFALLALIDSDTIDKRDRAKHLNKTISQDVKIDKVPLKINEEVYMPERYIANTQDPNGVEFNGPLRKALKERIELLGPYFDKIKGCDTSSHLPCRRQFLAICVFGRIEEVLSAFFDWVKAVPRSEFSWDDHIGKTTFTGFPHYDGQLPFIGVAQIDSRFGRAEAEDILENQWPFLPFPMESGMYETLPVGRPKPFYLKSHQPLGEGAAGSVFEAIVPAGLWRGPSQAVCKRTDRALSTSDLVFAVKCFRPAPDVDQASAVASAALNFENEKIALNGIKNLTSDHKHVMLDMGGLTEIHEGRFHVHWMFFPLGKCDLHNFLLGKALDTLFEGNLSKDQKGELYKHAFNLIDAVAWLHLYNYRHLDIKPENIIVFIDDSVEPTKMVWKIADFNYARQQRPRLHTLREVSKLINSKSTMRDRAPAVRGIFQAPEVREQGDYEKGAAEPSGDVWSVGALLLMVMTYIDGRYHAVERFMNNNLLLHSTNPRAELRSFYVGQGLTEWKDVEEESKHVLQHASTSPTPRTTLSPPVAPVIHDTTEVALNPKVVAWMKELYDKYAPNSNSQDISPGRSVGEVHLFQETCVHLQAKVLLPDKTKRVSAKEFYDHASSLLNQYEKYKDVPDTKTHDPTDSMDARRDSIPMPMETGPSDDFQTSPVSGKDKGRAVMQRTPTLSGELKPAPLAEHTLLCRLGGDDFKNALLQSHGDVDARCPRCNDHLLHKIISEKDHERLHWLLKFSKPSTMDTTKHNMTPFRLACRNNGDAETLEALRRYNTSLYEPVHHKALKDSKKLSSDALSVLALWKKEWNKLNIQQVPSGSSGSVGTGSATQRRDTSSAHTSNSGGSTPISKNPFKNIGKK